MRPPSIRRPLGAFGMLRTSKHLSYQGFNSPRYHFGSDSVRDSAWPADSTIFVHALSLLHDHGAEEPAKGLDSLLEDMAGDRA